MKKGGGGGGEEMGGAERIRDAAWSSCTQLRPNHGPLHEKHRSVPLQYTSSTHSHKGQTYEAFTTTFGQGHTPHKQLNECCELMMRICSVDSTRTHWYGIPKEILPFLPRDVLLLQ